MAGNEDVKQEPRSAHAGHEHHANHEHANHEAVPVKGSFFSELRSPTVLFFIAMTLAIIILAVFFRIPMLKYYGFYEPDGFYHYSVIRDAVQHGLIIQHYLPISGWPSGSPVTEPYGLYWATLIPYAILQYLGISYYTIERLVPLLFGVLDVLGAYLLSRYISKDKFFGLLVMLFVALSGGDEARTSALIYRADGFVAIFLLLALVFFLEAFRGNSRNRKMLFGILAGVSLALCSLVFSGAAFALIVYALSFFMILVFAFIFAKRDMLDNLKYPLMGIFVWWLLALLFLSQGWVQPQLFVGTQFFYLFVPMLLAWAIPYMLLNRSELVSKYVDVSKHLGTAPRRALFVALLAVVFAIAIIVGASGLLYLIFVNNGFITSGNSNVAATSGSVFASTIQELQPPTPGFLFASFGINIYMTLPSLLVLLSSYISSYLNYIFILVFISFLPYLFMQVYDSGKFMSGRPRLMFDINLGMLVLFAYFAVTAYLQMHAIRFNSLIAIPIAMLSAYTLYWLVNYAKSHKGPIISLGSVFASLLALFVAIGIWVQLDTLLPSALSSQSLGSAVAAIFGIVASLLVLVKYIKSGSGGAVTSAALIVLSIVYAVAQSPSFAGYPTVAVASVVMVLAMIALAAMEYFYDLEVWYAYAIVIIVYVILYYNVIYTAGLVQADSLDPAFFTAMQWFKANSPQNASVLTLWPDGSVVEGITNRSSVTDSVGSQNGYKADTFAAWLFNASTDPGFLTSANESKPGYFVIRNTWLAETGGIFTEASVANPDLQSSNYSYIRFSSFSENINASTVLLSFTSQPVSNGEELGATISILRNATNQQTGSNIESRLLLVNSTTGRELGTLALSSVTFYNQSSGAFSQVPVSNVSKLSGYTILLNYSAVQRPGSTINVTGALAVGPGLANSNMFRLLYLCDASACEMDSNTVAFTPVYQNSDTKIYKLTYNSIT